MEQSLQQAPVRSLDQRMAALKRANDIRVARADTKRDLKAGREDVVALVCHPPESLHTMRLYDLLQAVPKIGKVKAKSILTGARISESKTLLGLSDRQRTEVADVLRRKGL